MSLTSLEDTIKERAKKYNNAHITLIDGMSMLMTGKVRMFQSSDFHDYGLKWTPIIRSDFANNYLSFYLMLTDKQCVATTNWEVRCSYKLILVASSGPDECKSFASVLNSIETSGGERCFIKTVLLPIRFIVNDKAIFGIEITDVKAKLINISNIPRAMVKPECIRLMEVPRNNSRFTWKITQFSSFNGRSHSSYEFTVGPRRWKLTMYPKGDRTGVEQLSLFLTATDYVTNGPKAKTFAIYKMRVLDQFKRKHYETKHETWFVQDPIPMVSIWGQTKFLSLEELHDPSRGFLVNDEIYIGVEFLLVSSTEYLY